MTEIAIYVEGGGDSAQQKAELRNGFDGLLKDVKSKAREKRLGWKLVPAGGRQATYEAFINALSTNPDTTLCVLLVDSEEPLASSTNDAPSDARSRVAHLKHRDGWDFENVSPESVHVMVQCMEAWIVADVDALAMFYGQRFARTALPARGNLEDESKIVLCDKLARATRATKKGEYAKIRHASQLLQRLDSTKVAQRCPHFAVLVQWLEKAIASA